MAENTVITQASPAALQDQEFDAKDVSSCCILSNNNDGIPGIEQDGPVKVHHASQRSESFQKSSVGCNGKPFSHNSTKMASSESDVQELLDTSSEVKKFNGLIHNEHSLNDKNINSNGIRDIESASNSDSKHIEETNPTSKCFQNCDVSSRVSNLHCIPKQCNPATVEVDTLSGKLEDISVDSSSNAVVSSEYDNESARELKERFDGHGIEYVVYESEKQMPDIMRLITKDLSEPYSIYTYRYFIHNWPKLCFLAKADDQCVGAIVCKLDLHKKMARRGYIAMLAVDSEYRRRQIGSTLVTKAIEAMIKDDCDEVVLETEITNQGALHLYENLGFVRDKRLFRYYLNGVDALRLKLWLR
ncbi:hypothetical protein EGW08_006769 [Elysia chlorotica]|uniref:N-terminal methionine N(alpha)-acetyltransferase NatC n=1 Tax=Elysia chlorotica TaxID=188477 RepID=A0A3S1BD18_ELYCH|nr:hypothetical protein EGW08_006769 [Elysia chlorotica]